MSMRYLWWAGLIGASAAIPLVQTFALTKKVPATEIARTAKTITVRISDSKDTGSGVILQKQGDVYTVLTAAHVLKQGNYTIYTPDDRQHQIIAGSIRKATNSDIDLAIFKFKASANYPVAKLGDCNILTTGMNLYVGGFPLATQSITEPDFVFREGKIFANSFKVLNNGYSLIYSNDIFPGMSGGPVLNEAGEVVAIHGRGDRDESGSNTGFNLGIPINRFAMVATNLGVTLNQTIAAIPRQSGTVKPDDYIVLAGQKYEKGDYRGALADFDRAIQLNPNYGDTYNYRGTLKSEKLQNVQEALADYNRAIQINPNDTIAYSNRGALKATRLQDVQGALADFNRAIQIDPNFVTAYNHRGFLKEDKLQDVQGALADYDRAIQIDPNFATAYYNRGLLKQQKLQDAQGALADYNHAIQIDPNFAMAYYNRGLLKQDKLQDAQGALADYNHAIQIDPNDAMAYNHRGSLKQQKLQDVKGALSDYNRAIQIDPNYADAFGWRGRLKYERLNDRSGAINDFKRAGELYQRQGNKEGYQWAIDYLNRISDGKVQPAATDKKSRVGDGGF